MFSEIQKILTSYVTKEIPVELVLIHEYGHLKIQMYVTYISYRRGVISIQSDLTLLTLHPESISTIGNQLAFSRPDSFTATIEFPDPDSKILKILDEEIREVNSILKSYIRY